MVSMLECQSRQKPMKSKRAALICPVRFVGSVDIVVYVCERQVTCLFQNTEKR